MRFMIIKLLNTLTITLFFCSTYANSLPDNGVNVEFSRLQAAMKIPHEEFVTIAQDFYPRNQAKEELGRLLMFDKILSGNKNISCATCHHPLTATGDGLSLSVGEGGRGLGVTRDTGRKKHAIKERVPRNAPHVFNLGAKEFTSLFYDGRVAVDPTEPSGFRSPAGENLPNGLENVLAVQAMFPVTSATEMAGQAGENRIADAAARGDLAGPKGVWARLAKRLRRIPEYVQLFKKAFPDQIKKANDITYVHAANAIAAFESAAWQCTNSAFDRLMKGEFEAISLKALRGALLFYTKANCVTCHSGKFQTDHKFHAIAMPQIGPGKGDNSPGYNDGHEDFGRERVTQDTVDRFKFRTPSLRQVVLTGPWGHDGAYNSLAEMVRHHLNPVQALNNYDVSQAVLPPRADLATLDGIIHADPIRRQAIADANELAPVNLTNQEISDLMAFLHALTDFNCLDLRRDVPLQVPSGLPLAE